MAKRGPEVKVAHRMVVGSMTPLPTGLRNQGAGPALRGFHAFVREVFHPPRIWFLK